MAFSRFLPPLFLLLPLLLPALGDELCLKTGPCQCTSSNGNIDLTPLAKTDNTPKFPDVLDDSTGTWYYSYNPCQGFNEGSCSNVAVCQTDMGSQYYDAGDASTATFVFDATNNVNQIKYTSTDSMGTTRTTYVTLKCDQSQEGALDAKGEDPTIKGQYELTLTSKYCCPSGTPFVPGGSKSLSGGSIVLIIFFALLFVYFVGGTVVMTFARKATGPERIPNVSFWTALPGLVKDGFLFTFRCGKTSYSNI